MQDRTRLVELIQGLSAAERLGQPDPTDWLKEYDQMADDKTTVGGQNQKRINSSEISEVHDWATSLGVTPNALRKAIAAVGDQVENVREYLKKK